MEPCYRIKPIWPQFYLIITGTFGLFSVVNKRKVGKKHHIPLVCDRIMTLIVWNDWVFRCHLWVFLHTNIHPHFTWTLLEHFDIYIFMSICDSHSWYRGMAGSGYLAKKAMRCKWEICGALCFCYVLGWMCQLVDAVKFMTSLLFERR